MRLLFAIDCFDEQTTSITNIENLNAHAYLSGAVLAIWDFSKVVWKNVGYSFYHSAVLDLKPPITRPA
jgi:hypothetical protein